MGDKKYIIMIAIISVLIIIIGVIYISIFKNQNRTENKKNDALINPQGENFIEFEGGKIKLADEKEYYIINEYMSEFLNALAYDSNLIAYELIDKIYAEQNSITQENIIEKLKFSDKYQEYETEELFYVDLTEYSKIYIVYGDVREKNSDSGVKKRIEAIINVDFENLTFSIIPYSKGTLDKDTLDIEKITENFKKIEKTENNSFSIFTTTEKMKASKLFNKYITETLYYTNDAYEMLDEEYKNKRFGSLEKYRVYVSENEMFIKNLIIDSYSTTKKEGYTEYRIMDNYGNMYIFNVTNLLNYTVKLDDYTIETEEFLNKYNSASIQNKVSLNIGKFFSMLNAKDYDSAYACLADGFKQNYFPTVDHFKKYVENNFFKSNKLEGVSFENEGETYMLTVKISDYRGRDTKTIEKTIIMQLREGTDFVMSFNVD